MSARTLKVATAALVAGCAVGPAYHPAPVVPASTEFGTFRQADSTRRFFDSLAAARGSRSSAPTPARRAPTSSRASR